MTTSIEPLESRIAPATLVNPTTVSYHDQDGDLVTIKFTKPLLTDVATANAIFHFDTGVVVATGQPDATLQQLQLVDFSNHPLLIGTGLTVTAKLTGHGDGFANIGRINSPGVPLGAVSIHGDLGSFVVGDDGTNALSIKSLTVQSIGRYGTSTQAAGGDLNSSVTHGLGALNVKSDIVDATLTINGGGSASLGNVTIGGSLIGGAAAHSGVIHAANIGNVTIGGDVRGGDGGDSGVIRADFDLGNVKLGGSLLGGTGAGSAQFTGEITGYSVGAITIAGDMNAGTHDESGKIVGSLKIKSLTVKGSIIGGAGSESTSGNNQEQGQVNAQEGIGNITIGGDLRGGSGASGAEIFTSTNTLGVIKIGGSLVGGGGANTGLIKNTAGPTGAITIGGDIVGDGGPQSGGISTGYSVASVTVKGSVTGAAGSFSGHIQGVNMVGPVVIGGSLTGGGNDHTGFVGGNVLKTVSIGGSLLGGGGKYAGAGSAVAGLTGVTVGGSVVGGSSTQTGYIENFSDITGQITIGQSIVGGSASFSGAVVSHGKIGGLTLGGSLVAGTAADTGEILARQDIDALTIKGGIFGTAAQRATIAVAGVRDANQPTIALPKISITGDVQFADITAGAALGVNNGDGQIGSVTVGGDFIASSIAAGVAPGPNGYGVGDTLLPGGTAAVLSSIASITIGGEALGTPGGTDQYGIVAEGIKSIKVGGNVLVLTSGAHNDNRPLGTTGDLTIHEV